MTSFSHREFKYLLITQRFTLCQMVDFSYNIDIYDTNIVYIKNLNYEYSFLRYYVIITLQNRMKSLNLPQLSYYRDKIMQLHHNLNLF